MKKINNFFISKSRKLFGKRICHTGKNIIFPTQNNIRKNIYSIEFAEANINSLAFEDIEEDNDSLEIIDDTKSTYILRDLVIKNQREKKRLNDALFFIENEIVKINAECNIDKEKREEIINEQVENDAKYVELKKNYIIFARELDIVERKNKLTGFLEFPNDWSEDILAVTKKINETKISQVLCIKKNNILIQKQINTAKKINYLIVCRMNMYIEKSRLMLKIKKNNEDENKIKELQEKYKNM